MVVLSYEGWQAFFGGDPKVVGETLRVGGDPSTVIAVLSPSVRFPQIALAPKIASGARLAAMIYTPLAPSDWDLSSDTGNFNYSVIARLKPGATLPKPVLSWSRYRRGTPFLLTCRFISGSP